MANLYANSQQISGGGGFLTPRYGYGAGAAVQQGQTQAFSKLGTQGVKNEDPWWLTVGGSLAGAPVDIIDSLAAITPWSERGQVNDAVYNSVGLGGYAEWVRRNHGAVEVASGVTGMVVGGLGVEIAASRLVGSAWMASTGLGGIMKASSWSVDNARKAAQGAMIRSAQAGQPYRWYQAVEGRKFIAASVANVAGRSAVSESAMMAALNQNSFIWSEDMGDNARNFILGVGIGGVVGGVMARGQVQKWATSPEVTREIAEVFDPTGLERGMNAIPLSGSGNPYSYRPSAEITQNAIIATRDTVKAGGVGTNMAKASDQLAIQTRRQVEIMRGFQKVGTRGVESIPASRFSVTDASGKPTNAVGRHLQEAIQADPTLVYGLDEMGIATSKTAQEMVQTREAALRGILKDKEATRAAKATANHRLNQTAAVLANKTWIPANQADELISFQPGKVVTKPTAKKVAEVQWLSPSTGQRLSLNEQGTLSRPLEDLTTHQQLETFTEAIPQWLAKMQATKTTMVIPKEPTWLNLDLAAEYMARGGAVDLRHHPNLQTVEAIQVASLAKKGEKIANLDELDYLTRMKYNLPQATTYERTADPHGDILKRITKAAAVDGATLDELKAVRQEVSQVFDMIEDSSLPVRLDGDMLNYNKSTDGRWMTPVIGFFDDVPTAKWSKTDLKEMARESAATEHLFMTRRRNSLVTALATRTEQFPMRQLMGDISGLADEQLASTSNIGSQVAAQTLTAAHRNRNIPQLLAAQQYNMEMRQLKDTWVRESMTRLQPITDKLKATAGRKSSVLLNQYMSLANSFDIADAVQLPDGLWAFRLNKKSDINAEWLQRYPQEGDFLRNPNTGNIVTLDDLGNQARIMMENETKGLLKEVNSLRISQGLTPIQERPFFAPPRSTKGKIVGFTLDPSNRVIRGKAIIAENHEDFARQAAELRKELKPELGYNVLTTDQIRDFAGLWEELGLDFIDPTQVARPSGARSGTLSTGHINAHAWDDALTYLQNGYDSTLRGVIEAKFSGPLKTARVRSAAQTQVKGAKEGVKNIWDTYSDTLLGVNPSVRDVGVNPVFSKMEGLIDQTISTVWGPGRVGTRHLSNLFLMAGRTPKAAKSFSELTDQLKDHMPFKHVSEFIEYERGVATSPTVRGIAQGLNRLSAGVILRWLEVPHAAMNLLGVVTAMPGMMGARNLPAIGRVKGVPIVDSMKILGLGFKDMMSKSRHADWEYMKQMGYTGEAFANMHMTLSTVDSHNSFMRAFVGDPSAAARAEFKHGDAKSRFRDKDYWKGKGIEGVISAFTDTSENMSRVWSHFVGLRLADYHGITKLEARHRFAKQISDDAIANYDPLNRPEIFQSAFGSMYGLFLSYSQNYYQRMFRYLEDADFNALGRTAAVQASLFGINSLPGSRDLANLIGGQDSGDGFLDGLYQRFGPAAGSVIANGGVNQLTTIFNLIPGVEVPALSIHSRGDVNFRHPTSDSILSGKAVMPVGVEIITDMINGIVDVVGKTVNPDTPMSGRHAAEILARHMPNRTLKGLMVVTAGGGQEADAYGNLMAETQGWAETLYRSLGLRSGRQQAEIEAYFLNRQAQMIEGQRMDTLRQATKALIREGAYDRLPEVFDNYLAAGGKPWNYTSWIRDQIRTAQETRTQNQLQQFLRSPGNQVLANRIKLFTGE